MPTGHDRLRRQTKAAGLRKRVELLSFAEYQLGYDLRPYAQRQAQRLARDSAYAPSLYVAQRYTEIGSYATPEDPPPVQEDLLDRCAFSLSDPNPRVVRGAIQGCKTFLSSRVDPPDA